jgi:Ni/Co efflux regulator RcnB
LAPAPIGCHWVEVDGQALLIQDATGAVIQAAPL